MSDLSPELAKTGPGISPYDTASSAGLRFLVELAAWIAGPWAVAVLTERWWAAIPAAVVLIALPAVFSTPGDKTKVIVATPGPVRLLIELLLAVVAVLGAWIAWPTWAAVIVTLIVLASLVVGGRRTRWLLRGTPWIS